MSLNRRRFFQMSAGLLAASLIPVKAFASLSPVSKAKSLRLHNLHTGETLQAIFWEQGRYIPESLIEMSHILRDHRTGDVKPMDPQLFDMMYRLLTLAEKSEIHIISGYRSKASNAALHASSSGVAKRSLHMEGKAVDIRIPGYDLAYLQKAALSLKAGGVGYYPASDFVHIDTGRIRQWGS